MNEQEEMRVYVRVPRRNRAPEGSYISLLNFNRCVDLYNVANTRLGFWEYLSDLCEATIYGFDMARNVGNPAFKYVHIIKMKG